MVKKDKYLFNILFIFLLLFFSNFCVAFNLEIDYPQLSTGEQLTSQSTIPQYAKYMFNWGMAIGFLSAVVSLIFAGALYILSVARPGAKAMAMDRIYGTITGLILLLLVYLIVTTINPELSIFRTETLAPIVPPVETIVEPEGIFLYQSQNCTSSTSETNFSFRIGINSSLPDLADWKNKVNSINIVAGNYFEPGKQRLYFAILHDLINFQGKCEYFDKNGRFAGSEGNSGDFCKTIKPYAASVSVYRYDENPGSNPKNKSVTFYRKPFYDEKGGEFKVNNTEISGGVYEEELSSLEFKNVPEEEKDCTNWDFGNNCVERNGIPTLAGENINSIKIDGDYIVVLIYWDGGSNDIWPSCQVFPTPDDKNKDGPRQIKWEYIRNQFVMPNYVLIFPIVR